MSSRKVNRKRFSCGHTGFGTYCHRCEFAEKLETMAKAGKSYVDHKGPKHKKPHTWTTAEMLAEAERLKSSDRKVSVYD